jgi:leucyl aminopeptidase
LADGSGRRIEFEGITSQAAEAAVDVLVVPVAGPDDDLVDLPWLDRASGGEISRARQAGALKNGLYDVFITPLPAGGAKAARVALIGAGEAAVRSAERWRRVAAAGAYAARKLGVRSMGVVIRGAGDAIVAAQHAADGCMSPEFDGGVYKEPQPGPTAGPLAVAIVVPGADGARLTAAVRRGRIIGESSNFARSLANEPANVLTPAEFANRVAEAGRREGLDVDVLDEARITELDMRLLLSVAQGSALPPRLIVLKHNPPGAPASPVIGLIGKGITFDTGGVSIKPADGMDRMKSDMSGGAAVGAAMLAIARLQAPFKVIGLIPTAENMVGGRATRPGDVIRGASGKTVEINNTDAEGRLILGDALWYARQLGVTQMIDVATLTGACMVALGRHVSGLFGQPQPWVDAVAAAAAAAGDRVWPLPIYDEAREQLKSEIADMVNSAGRMGGAVTAAAFLREFAGDTPWAHLDIAGTSWAETKETYLPKGATGAAVRTLIELAMTGGRRSETGKA